MKYFFLLFLAGGLILTSCGKSEEEKAEERVEDASTDMEKATEAYNNAMTQTGGKKEVDKDKLKDWLPENLAGMERKTREVSSAGAMGMNATTATSEYRDGNKRVDVTVVHYQGMTNWGVMAAWANVEIDKEGDGYYEKTTTIGGRKAFVKYNENTMDGEMNIITDDGYIVNISANQLTEKEFQKLPDEINIDRLPRPKSAG